MGQTNSSLPSERRLKNRLFLTCNSKSERQRGNERVSERRRRKRKRSDRGRKIGGMKRESDRGRKRDKKRVREFIKVF